MGGVILGKLKIREHMTTKEKRMALEAALLLGFQAEASVFPVAGPKGEISVPENEEELKSPIPYFQLRTAGRIRAGKRASGADV